MWPTLFVGAAEAFAIKILFLVLALGRLREEDCPEFHSNLGFKKGNRASLLKAVWVPAALSGSESLGWVFAPAVSV